MRSLLPALTLLLSLVACQAAVDEDVDDANQAATGDVSFVVTALQRTTIKTSTLDSSMIGQAGMADTDLCVIEAGTRVTLSKAGSESDAGHMNAQLVDIGSPSGVALQAPCGGGDGARELPMKLRLGSRAYFFQKHFSGWQGSSAAPPTPPTPPTPPSSGQFGQADIDPSKVVVVALPAGRLGRRSLHVFEQLGTRPCFAKSGASPVVVDALLLQFDFTNICGRAADTNGYQVRVAGADQRIELGGGITLQDEGGEVVLHWISSARDVVLGRTHGVGRASEIVEVDLEPGWRMTHRTFQGKPLGLFYFTHDAPL